MQNKLSRYYFNNLNNEEKSAYKCVKRALLNLKSKISFPYVLNVYKVIEAVRWDCPQIFYVNWITILHRVEFFSDGKIKISVPYLYRKPAIKQLMVKIRKTVARFKNINDPFLLAVKVHDFFAYNVSYDNKDISFGGFKYRNHNIVGALVGKSAVCEGFAKAFQFILNLNGVDCMTVVGQTKTNGVTDTGLHAWNLVSLNGENYMVDVTWDLAKDINNDYRTDYAYFLLDAEEANKDHVHKVKVLINGKQKNIFRVLGRFLDDEQKVRLFLQNLRLNKGYLARVKGVSESVVKRLITEHAIKIAKQCTYIQYSTGVLYVKFY